MSLSPESFAHPQTRTLFRRRVVNVNGVLWLILAAALLWDVFGMFIFIIRISGRDPSVPKYYALLNAGLLLVALAAVGYVFVNWLASSGPLDPELFHANAFFALLLFFGCGVAFLRGAELQRPFAGQLYYWLVMTLGYTLGLLFHVHRHSIQMLERVVGSFSYAILVVSAIGYAVLESLRHSTGAMYIGSPSSTLLLPLSYFIVGRKWFMTLLTFGLIVLTGKRGPLIASCLLLLFALARGRYFRVAVLIVILVALLPLAVSGIDSMFQRGLVYEESAVGHILRKWRLTITARADNIELASSGRSHEIELATDLIREPGSLLTGRGFGWSIFNYNEGQTDALHFVHLSYLNWLVTYGLIGLIALLTFWAIRIQALARAYRRQPRMRLLRVITLFVIAFIFLSFTVNQMLVSLPFWILLGVAVRITDSTETLARESIR